MVKLFYCYIILQLLFCKELSAQCPTASDFLNGVTNIQNNNDSYKEKIKQLQQLRKSFSSCNTSKDSVYARIVHRLGDMYSKINEFEKAIDYTKEAIAVNSQNNSNTERSYLANSYLNLGLFYKWLNLLDDALNCFDSCILTSIKFPDKYFIAYKAFEEKAYVFFQRGDYQKSIETADKGILFAQKLKDTLQEVNLLSRKAQAQVELKNISEAGQNITKAITILEKISTDTNYLAINYSIYANLLSVKGDTKLAMEYHKKSFNLNKAKGNWIDCSRDLLNMGFVYDENLNNGPKALECYNEGIQMLDKVNDAYQLAGLYINMGVVYWRRKDYKQELQFYQKALNVLPIHFNDTSIKSNPSIDMLKQVSNDYFVTTLLYNKGHSLLELYKTEKNIGFLQTALNTFTLADKSVDLMRWKQNAELSKVFWREKTKEMYENAIETCHLLNDVERGFYFFEKSRAVLLNDKLSELGAKKYISQPDRVKEQQLRIKISSLNQQLASLDETSASYGNTKEQLLSAQEEMEKFIKSLERKYPVYYQYKYDNTVYSLQKIKNKLLASNQSLIEYFTADSVVYVLYLSNTNNRFLKIPFEDYDDAIKELMRLCSDKTLLNQNFQRYSALAYQLYEKLFKPLQVPEGRVIVSPDEYFIPFEALLSDAGQPTSFLLKKYAFSYAYSAGLLMKSNDASSAGNSFLGIAPIDFQPYLHQQSLTGADQSLENIKPYFQSADFLIKEQASKQQFLRTIPQFNIVQIYSHADADSSAKQPVLYLNDSAINISEIQTLEDLQTSLIVLSACKTGFGKNAKGEGIFSLARAFMAAGIPSTVTTLWQVDNKATYQLTEAFYKYLTQGLTKDVAMQKAKLEFLQSNDKTYELPYYWAANILLGKTDIINKKSTFFTFPVAMIIITLLIIILVLIFGYKKSVFNKRRDV